MTQTNDKTYQEWVYHAEVYGEVQQALAHLRPLHDQTLDQDFRQELAKAIATVHILKGQPEGTLTELMSVPRTVVIKEGVRRIYSRGQWFHVGDWLDQFYIEEIYFDRLELRHRDGGSRMVPLAWNNADIFGNAASGILMESMSASEILGFLSNQANMSYFIPGSLNLVFSGFVPDQPWLQMLQSIGDQFNIQWTRHQDNIVFHQGPVDGPRFRPLPLVELRNEPLGLFLASLANHLGMDLMFSDASVADISVDIRLENQPWNEVMDCLGIMSDFSWHLIEGESESRQTLFIQKNN
jgi:hypothetical protein